jgi:hypothetical protein
MNPMQSPNTGVGKKLDTSQREVVAVRHKTQRGLWNAKRSVVGGRWLSASRVYSGG